MTEPMIEQTEVEKFTEDLSDEALDREEGGRARGSYQCSPPPNR